MDLRSRILNLLSRRNKALDSIEILQQLNLSLDSEILELSNLLREMADSYEIYCSNKGRYMLFEKSPLKKGKLSITRKGYGFVDLEEDIFISADHLNGAVHGDMVIVEIIGKKDGRRLEGRILKVIERSLHKVIGEFYFENGIGHLILDEEKLKITVDILPEHVHGAVDGSKVVVKLLDEDHDQYYHGEVIEILGHKNDPGVDILSIARKYDIEDQFPEEVIEQLKHIPEEV
ncbi:MAG: ribonuclease R, partial [bacterium]|nr:ribonuclease R [bacterium]